MPFKLTTAQQLILHVLESTVASIVITVVVGAIQFISTHGLNFGELGTVCATLFLGALSMGYKSITGNPNFGQATLDSLAEIKELIPAALQPASVQPPVIVNVQHPATVTQVAPPASSQAPVAEQPQFQPTPWQQQEAPFLGRPNTANTMPTTTFPVPVVTPR